MYEELQLMLMDVVSPEQLMVLLDAQRTLNELGLTTADDELLQIMGLQNGTADTNMLVSRVNDVFIYAVGQALNEYGVVVNSDASLPLMVAILQTVGRFEFYAIPETLVDLTSALSSNEEILASIVPLFTDVDVQTALDNLDDVSDATIARMKQVAGEIYSNGHSLDETPIDPNYNLKIKRINAIRNKTQGFHPQLTVDLANTGVRLGQSLDMLIPMVFEQLDSLELVALSYELLGLVYFSNTNLDEIPNVINDLAEDITDYLPQQMRLKMYLKDAFDEISGLEELRQ